MKFNKLSYHLLAFLLLVIGACNEKEFYDIPIGPPSDLQLIFTLANDDSGRLSVYPEATGAAYFDLYYGDGTSEPERVQTGGSGTHVYAEGTYTLRAVAYSLSGESTETNQDVSIQFTPPANLTVDVAIDPVNTNMVTVTPTADNATLFEVYFGEVADEEPTSIMPGEAVVHTYAETGNYTLRVVARSASQTSLEYTEELMIVKPAVQLTLPIDFENPEIAYVFSDFGGATATVVANPDASGENTSAQVGQLVKAGGAEVWAGSLLQLPNPIDFASGDQFSVKVWSPKSGVVVKLKVENSADPNINYEVDVTNTQTNAWEDLIYDFSGIDKSKAYDRVVIFFDFGNPGDGTKYYFDDIRQYVEEGGSGDILQLPLTFESNELTYEFVAFGDVAAEVQDNPDPGGINTSDRVGKLTKANGAATWGGAFLELPDPIDFSTMDQIELKAWSPKAGINVLMKLENATNGDIFHEVQVVNTTTNAWEILTFDMSTIDKSKTYHKVVLFFDFGVNGDGSEYYFDDVRLK